MKNVFILILTLLILSGCSSKKRVVSAPKTLPTWYSQEMKSNARTLYSVGEGEDKAKAITNALNAMVSTLSVSISSEFNMKSVVQDGVISSIQRDSTHEVNSQVKAIRISNYQIIESKEFAFQRYLVAISSDKKSLFLSLYKEISQKFESIKRKHEESVQFNLIKRLSLYKKDKESMSTLKNTLIVINSLNPSFNDSIYVRQVLEVENRYDSLLSKITFSVDANSDARRLIPSIANGLSLSKYNIVKKINGKNHLRVRLNASTVKARSYGFTLARSAISITVKDSTSKVIGSNKLNITGQSTQGYEIAKENVAVKLNTKVLQEGIEKIIGLEL
ncbi:MAG: hypothetical protein ACI9TV_001835 [Sulfurimonas sp.]|jgi:hypothetical protein|uniref:LPP20 family lipoprotein n=1 Tax=Sulfurimonas sp. TaxID=2022749 RepID=UPI0039E35A45